MDFKEDHDAIVSRVLEENDHDAEHVLSVLVRVIVGRHVDCELRKMGRRSAWTPGNERLNALTAAMDALHETKSRLEQDCKDASGALPAAVQIDVAVMQTLFQMLGNCQFAGEYRAGIIDENGEERPIMRLVED